MHFCAVLKTFILRHDAHAPCVVRMVLIAVTLIVTLFLLVGCGEARPTEAVDSTLQSSASTGLTEAPSQGAPSGLPKLVDVGSDSCVPCRLMAPELEALAQQYAGAVQVVIVDVYEDLARAKELGVQVIPTQIFFDPTGKEFFRHEGFLSLEDMVSRFQQHGYPLGKGVGSRGQETGSGDGGG